jgi:hypothetical protein
MFLTKFSLVFSGSFLDYHVASSVVPVLAYALPQIDEPLLFFSTEQACDAKVCEVPECSQVCTPTSSTRGTGILLVLPYPILITSFFPIPA